VGENRNLILLPKVPMGGRKPQLDSPSEGALGWEKTATLFTLRRCPWVGENRNFIHPPKVPLGGRKPQLDPPFEGALGWEKTAT